MVSLCWNLCILHVANNYVLAYAKTHIYRVDRLYKYNTRSYLIHAYIGVRMKTERKYPEPNHIIFYI